jgi:GT2 family glycosyltransferase
LSPREIVIVVPSPQDLPAHLENDGLVRCIIGPLGGSVQRNAAIETIPLTVGYVAFFDDDFELDPDYLARVVAFLDANPSIVACSGQELAIGATVSRSDALRMLGAPRPDPGRSDLFAAEGPNRILYGCNMVIRRAILQQERFDETLPLYSYGEDYDLSMRLRRLGRVGLFRGAVGVHLQSTGGRVREIQRGYAQIANHWYFLKKGTVHLSPPLAFLRFWSKFVLHPTLDAFWKILQHDSSCDWSGRLKGYLLAVFDIFRGRSHPRRILDL